MNPSCRTKDGTGNAVKREKSMAVEKETTMRWCWEWKWNRKETRHQHPRPLAGLEGKDLRQPSLRVKLDDKQQHGSETSSPKMEVRLALCIGTARNELVSASDELRKDEKGNNYA